MKETNIAIKGTYYVFSEETGHGRIQAHRTFKFILSINCVLIIVIIVIIIITIIIIKCFNLLL